MSNHIFSIPEKSDSFWDIDSNSTGASTQLTPEDKLFLRFSACLNACKFALQQRFLYDCEDQDANISGRFRNAALSSFIYQKFEEAKEILNQFSDKKPKIEYFEKILHFEAELEQIRNYYSTENIRLPSFPSFTLSNDSQDVLFCINLLEAYCDKMLFIHQREDRDNGSYSTIARFLDLFFAQRTHERVQQKILDMCSKDKIEHVEMLLEYYSKKARETHIPRPRKLEVI